MKQALLFFLTLALARAQTVFHEGYSVNPGRVDTPVMVISVAAITLLEPGTYIAPTWSFFGGLKLAKPGNYTIVAQSGSITFNPSSAILAPSQTSLPSRITFMHAGDLVFNTTKVEGPVSFVQGIQPPPEAPPLVNLSVRITAVENQPIIAGFVVSGNIRRQVLIRAVGPSLANFGVSRFLAGPVLSLYRGAALQGRPVTGWEDSLDVAAASTMVGAFPLNAGSRDAAMVTTLQPGSYTVNVTGGSGDVLIEVYLVN